jgi:hypothetical protein
MKTTRILQRVLVGFLLVGSTIAWSTVVLAFVRFYRAEGTLLKFTNCVMPNPATTPCFFGALAFAVGLVWAARLLGRSVFAVRSYRRLQWLLVASTIFGWSNVAYEFWKFEHNVSGLLMTCTAEPVSTPFESPCFYGSTMFLAALVAVTWLLRAARPAATAS